MNEKDLDLRMAQIQLTLGIIFAVLSVILIIISTAIAGIIGGKQPAGDLKNRLFAITSLTALTLLFSVITGILGILYARAKGSQASNTKGLGIAFLVFVIVTALMYVVIIALTLTSRNNDSLSTTDKNALTASLIITATALVMLIISTIIFFTLTKGKSGAEAKSALKFQKRGSSKSM